MNHLIPSERGFPTVVNAERGPSARCNLGRREPAACLRAANGSVGAARRIFGRASLGLILLDFACGNTPASNQTVAHTQQSLTDAAASARTDVVAVLSRVNGTDAWCTGIVLEPSLVLTAEHCLLPAADASVTLDCATATLTAISSTSQAWVAEGTAVSEADSSFIAVSNVRVPAAASRLCGDDIALLELSAPLEGATFASLTPSVPVAPASFTSVGYGTDGMLSGILRENDNAELQCVGAACADVRIAESELLAVSGACEGDSGGPAIDTNGNVFAMAVRSRADCGQTAYLQLASHYVWLAQNAAEIAKSAGVATPDWAAAALNITPSATPDAAVTPEPQLHVGGGGCSVAPRESSPAWAALLLLGIGIRWQRRAGSADTGNNQNCVSLPIHQ